jgi:hypothetical protein
LTEVKDLEVVRVQNAELARELGLAPAEVLQLVNPFIVVEGEHDKVIMDAWLGDSVGHRNPDVIAMRGASNLVTILDSTLLFEYTTAHVIVILDAISNASDFAETWAKAREFANETNIAAALAEIHSLRQALGRNATYEQQVLLEFATQAVRAGHQRRLELFGFKRRDIVEYFPPDSFGLEGDWDMLWNQYQNLRDGGRTTMSFKVWLSARHEAEITMESLLAAFEAGRAADLQPELEELRKLL